MRVHDHNKKELQGFNFREIKLKNFAYNVKGFEPEPRAPIALLYRAKRSKFLSP